MGITQLLGGVVEEYTDEKWQSGHEDEDDYQNTERKNVSQVARAGAQSTNNHCYDPDEFKGHIRWHVREKMAST